MEYRSRRLVRQEHLNPRGTLFGGTCMQWIDEEAAIYVMCQLGTPNVVTKLISEINFISPAHLGDIVEFGMNTLSVGKTSITVECTVRIKGSSTIIVKIDKMVFVSVDEDGHPVLHGKWITPVQQTVSSYECSYCGNFDDTVNRNLFDGMCADCASHSLYDDGTICKKAKIRNQELEKLNQ